MKRVEIMRSVTGGKEVDGRGFVQLSEATDPGMPDWMTEAWIALGDSVNGFPRRSAWDGLFAAKRALFEDPSLAGEVLEAVGCFFVRYRARAGERRLRRGLWALRAGLVSQETLSRWRASGPTGLAPGAEGGLGVGKWTVMSPVTIEAERSADPDALAALAALHNSFVWRAGAVLAALWYLVAILTGFRGVAGLSLAGVLLLSALVVGVWTHLVRLLPGFIDLFASSWRIWRRPLVWLDLVFLMWPALLAAVDLEPSLNDVAGDLYCRGQWQTAELLFLGVWIGILVVLVYRARHPHIPAWRVVELPDGMGPQGTLGEIRGEAPFVSEGADYFAKEKVRGPVVRFLGFVQYLVVAIIDAIFS